MSSTAYGEKERQEVVNEIKMWRGRRDKSVWKRREHHKPVMGREEEDMGCRGGECSATASERSYGSDSYGQILNMVSDNLIWPCYCVVFFSFHSLWMHDDRVPLFCAVTRRVRARSLNATLKQRQARGQSLTRFFYRGLKKNNTLLLLPYACAHQTQITPQAHREGARTCRFM